MGHTNLKFPLKIQRFASYTNGSVTISNLSGSNGLTGFELSYNSGSAWYHDILAYSYSKNNGSTWSSWVDNQIPNPNGTPQTYKYIISGLEVNTSYKFRFKYRVRSTQQGVDSGFTPTISTYNVNKFENIFYTTTNDRPLTLAVNSPSGASSKVTIELPNGTVRMTKTGSPNISLSVDEVNSLTQYMQSTQDTFYLKIYTIGNPNSSSYEIGYLNYNIVENNPTFSNFTYEDVNTVTTALTGSNQKCVVGYSNMKATVSVENKAIAKNYATMSKYRFVVGQDSVEAPYSSTSAVSMTLNKVTTGVLSVYAIDNYGCSTRVSIALSNVINYTDLTKDVQNSKVYRANPDGQENGIGERVKLKLKGTIWNKSFGSKNNTIKTSRYRYKKTNSNTWSSYVNVTTPTISSDGTFNFDNFISGDTDLGFDISFAYDLEVEIKDELSTISYKLILPSGKPHIAYHKNGIGIMGKYDADKGGLLQIDSNPLQEFKVIELKNIYNPSVSANSSSWFMEDIPLEYQNDYEIVSATFNFDNQSGQVSACGVQITCFLEMKYPNWVFINIKNNSSSTFSFGTNTKIVVILKKKG